MSEHDKFMAIAIAEAKAGAAMGEQPFGAVVVIGGEVVVRTRSLKVSTSDTTAHSETLAISQATRKLNRRTILDRHFRPQLGHAGRGSRFSTSTCSGLHTMSATPSTRLGLRPAAHVQRPRTQGLSRT